MPIVTALRASGRGRVAGAPEGWTWRTIPLEVAVRAGVTAGVELDRTRARSLRRELRRSEAVAGAARALRARERTAHELDSALTRKGVRRPERAEAIATLARAGLVDDVRVASARAASLAARGRGDAAIRWELERLGVASELVEHALGGLRPERERAESVVARAGSPRGAGALLARRGFDADTIEALCGAPGGAEDGGTIG
jgi:SOS response regulatory protein OraA/RecX